MTDYAPGLPVGMASAPGPILAINHLKKYFSITTGVFQREIGQVRAVDDVNLAIFPGETLGLVGESGCGKTTLGRCVVRLYKPVEGDIWFRTIREENPDKVINLATMSGKELMPYRREFQMIFQDPYSSLSPRRTVFDTISEPIHANRLASGTELEQRVIHLMEIVGLETRYLRRYPHAFSGGQRQRIGIARALATDPRLIVADEPISALDVSIQAQIINLLKDLQAEFHLSYLFIAHDLNVVRYISDRVAVMYIGRLVETAAADELFANPKHPYTETLLSAVPRSEPDEVRQRIVLEGEIPNPSAPPSGCYFHPRCKYAQPICQVEAPRLDLIGPDHASACHFADTLTLRGVE